MANDTTKQRLRKRLAAEALPGRHIKPSHPKLAARITQPLRCRPSCPPRIIHAPAVVAGERQRPRRATTHGDIRGDSARPTEGLGAPTKNGRRGGRS